MSVLARVLAQRNARKLKELYRTMDAQPAGALSDLFHGTKYVFPAIEGAPLGRFDNAKIGSGEGAQAFTYGHYATGSEDLGDEYRRSLSGQFGRAPRASYDPKLLRAAFPDYIKYRSPLGKPDELAGILSGKLLPGKLTPLSHARFALQKQQLYVPIPGSPNRSPTDVSVLPQVLSELGPEVSDAILHNERIPPEYLDGLRTLVDTHFAAQDFAPITRMGAKNLLPDAQSDVLSATLAPDELERVQSAKASMGTPRRLNEAITSGMADVSHPYEGYAPRRPTLFEASPWGDTNTLGIFQDAATGGRFDPDLNRHVAVKSRGWNTQRGYSKAIMEAMGTPALSDISASVGRNLLAQEGRYAMRDVLNAQGLGGLNALVGSTTPAAGASAPKGALYRVATELPPSSFWTLDSLIGEHSPELTESILLGLAEAAKTQNVPFSMYKAMNSTGHDTYRRLLDLAKNRTAMNRTISEKLLDEGVPGSQFLRGGQRDPKFADAQYNPEDFNFVFFDPLTADIVERKKAKGGRVP